MNHRRSRLFVAAVALVLAASLPPAAFDVAQARQQPPASETPEYGPAKGILLLTLVGADVATTTQLGVLQPLERKESPFQLSQFAQGERQAVLRG